MDGNDFGYLGGSNYLKGFEVLQRALCNVNHNGYEEAKVHATNFSHFSDPVSLEKCGFKLYGRLEKNEYEKFYRQIRCMIVPSIIPETFSYVTVEGLMRGRIIIASEIGAIPEVVEGCDGVFLFPSGDHKRLAEEMIYVKDLGKEKVIDLGFRNREIVKRRFSNEKTVYKFAELLYRVSRN